MLPICEMVFFLSLLFFAIFRGKHSVEEQFSDSSAGSGTTIIIIHKIKKMASEERNFRSYYYEKFGFRVVEEKKSIEILLKEQTVSIEKLKQFCLRFPLPAVYRIHVWKLLLGRIIP